MKRAGAAVFLSPVLWGLLASVAFYTLIHGGTLSGSFFRDYFASHWTEYVMVAMFFIALAQLLLKACDLAEQRASLGQRLFDDVLPVPLATDEARILHGQLTDLPANRRETYLSRRLREALETILRNGSTDDLDEELKYLSDVDAARAHASYSLVRIIIWAIPILGFLGTVTGLTLAIAGISPEDLINSTPQVVAGLAVAFNTTALALSLSLALMFVQFFVDRMEQRLLGEVDARAVAELAGRFDRCGAGRDPQVAAVRKMAEAVIAAAERMVQRQAEVWHATIEAAHDRWSHLLSAGQEQLERALAAAMVQSVEAHARQLAVAEDAAAEKNRRHWELVQQSLVSSAERIEQSLVSHTEQVRAALASTTQGVQQALAATADELRQSAEASQRGAQTLQADLVRQGDLLLRVVEGTSQVARLEESLNANLAALAGAQHFDETILNLSAAINLLNARLGQLPAHVGLKAPATAGKAA